MITPTLINLSLPKCGTLSSSLYFGGNNTIHEEFNNSFLRAFQLCEKNNDKSVMIKYLHRRYCSTPISIDCSGYLHSVKQIIFDLYPDIHFMRIIRDPINWSCSYAEMLIHKSRETDNTSCLGQDLFEYFYLNRIASDISMKALIKVDKDIYKHLLDCCSKYWYRCHENIFKEEKNIKIYNFTIDKMNTYLPFIAKNIIGIPLPYLAKMPDVPSVNQSIDQSLRTILSEICYDNSSFTLANQKYDEINQNVNQ